MNRPEAPASLVAEKAVLGAVLSGPHAYFSVAEVIQPQHFYRPINAKIFAAVRDIYNANKKFSLQRVVASVGDEFEDGKSTLSYVTALLRNADDGEINPLDFVDDIVEAWQRRKIADLQSWVGKEAGKKETIPADLLEQIKERIDAIQQNSQTEPLQTIGQLARIAVRDTNTARETGNLVGWQTDLPSLNALIGMIMPGDLGGIGGGMGEAKTVLATQILMHVQKSGPCILFEHEMDGLDIARRALAAATGIPTKLMRQGAIDLFEQQELNRAADELEHVPFRIAFKPKMTLQDIKAYCVREKQTRGLAGIAVDHLRLVNIAGKFDNKFDRMQFVTGELKQLAKELGIFVIVLAQKLQSTLRRDEPTPRLADFDGGGALTQDADWFVGLLRRERWLRERRPDPDGRDFEKWKSDMAAVKGKVEAHALKVREGEEDFAEFLLDGKRARIEEL